MFRLQAMTRRPENLQEEQIRRLSELGASLRQARQDLSLSLEDMAAKTMIRAGILSAIEQGRLNQLPEPVYIQGFIRRYADALGLDGVQVSSRFPTRLELRGMQPSWKNTPAAQLRPIHLYAIYVALIMAAISSLSYMMDRSASWSTVTIPAQIPTDPVQTDENDRRQSQGRSPAATATSPLSDSPVRVDVTLTAQSWLRIDVDGKTEFQGILPEGTQKTWEATSKVTIRAGNAGAVLVAYNNTQAQPMGAAGAVEEKTFAAEERAAALPTE